MSVPLNGGVPLNGLVLAGGQSSRMGRDKGLLNTSSGQTLIERASSLLLTIGAQKIMVSSHNPQIKERLTDHFANRGPVSGIHAALLQDLEFPLVVLPVDMPLMRADTLLALVEHGFSSDISCCYKDQCLPLFIRNPQNALGSANKLLSGDGNVSVWRFLNAIGAEEIETSETQCFKNSNTPEQWEECLNLLSNLTLK